MPGRRAGRDRRDPRPPPHRLDRDARSRSPRPSTRSARPPRWSSSASARTAWSPRPPTATMLLGAVLSDTVILNSPTTTERDNAVVEYLERVLGARRHRLRARDVRGDLRRLERRRRRHRPPRRQGVRRSPRAARSASPRSRPSGCGSSTAATSCWRRSSACASAKDYLLCALMVTDILGKGTEAARRGRSPCRSSAPSGSELDDGVLDLPGVMSRKKQVAPKILGAL